MNPLYVSLSALFFALSFLTVERGAVGLSSVLLITAYVFMYAFCIPVIVWFGGLVIKVFGGIG